MKLHHRVFGSGPPLVVLHGLLGSLDNWVPLAQRFASDFQVFLLDLRNHGRSPHSTDTSYDLMAEDVHQFLREQELAGVHLLGHSMGAKVAMRFAQLHPDAIARLVVVDMSPREYPARHDTLLDAMHALDLGKYQRRDQIDHELAAVVPDRTVRQFVLKNLGRDDAGRLIWKPNLTSLRASYGQLRATLPVSGTFAGPALFVRGGQSDYVHDNDLPLIRGLFPQVTLATIERAGHWVHADAPEEFSQIVVDFLWGET